MWLASQPEYIVQLYMSCLQTSKHRHSHTIKATEQKPRLKLPLLPQWHSYPVCQTSWRANETQTTHHRTVPHTFSAESSVPSASDEGAAKWLRYQTALYSQEARGLTSDKLHTMMCTKCQLWAPVQSGFSQGKVQHIQYHLTGYICSLFFLTIFQTSSGPQLRRSLAFLASVKDGRAYQMSFLSLIDNDNKSKAITYKILSSLRCCWMSAGTAAFPHKHFRYCFLLFG